MKKLVFAATMTILFAVSGCCTTRDAETGVSTDSYKSAITKVRDNLKDNIRPSIAAVLSSDTTHGQAWKDAKLELIDNTIILCEDTLAGKNAGAAAPTPAPVGEK